MTQLWWVLFVGGGVILVLVLAATSYALWVKPERRAWLARERFVVAAGIVFPLVTLSALLFYVYEVGEHFGAGPAPELRIEITGEQWWWRVRYLDAAGKAEFETANEIRVPAGAAVELALRSADVIHSFWVPSLAGKIDMIPGRTNRLTLTAASEGTYRGQCAEFCGGAHALMALHVVAQSADDFGIWKENQARTAASAHALFIARCASCHTVRGTDAAGTRGPDLTHVGSRLFIGAGLLPNNAGTLAAWIASSQHLKPGNLMPSFAELGAEELQALAQYLVGLK